VQGVGDGEVAPHGARAVSVTRCAHRRVASRPPRPLTRSARASAVCWVAGKSNLPPGPGVKPARTAISVEGQGTVLHDLCSSCSGAAPAGELGWICWVVVVPWVQTTQADLRAAPWLGAACGLRPPTQRWPRLAPQVGHWNLRRQTSDGRR